MTSFIIVYQVCIICLGKHMSELGGRRHTLMILVRSIANLFGRQWESGTSTAAARLILLKEQEVFLFIISCVD